MFNAGKFVMVLYHTAYISPAYSFNTNVYFANDYHNLANTAGTIGGMATDSHGNNWCGFGVYTSTSRGEAITGDYEGTWPDSWGSSFNANISSLGTMGVWGASNSNNYMRMSWPFDTSGQIIDEILTGINIYIFTSDNDCKTYLEMSSLTEKDVFAEANAINYYLINSEPSFKTDWTVSVKSDYKPIIQFKFSCEALNSGEFDPNAYSAYATIGSVEFNEDLPRVNDLVELAQHDWTEVDITDASITMTIDRYADNIFKPFYIVLAIGKKIGFTTIEPFILVSQPQFVAFPNTKLISPVYNIDAVTYGAMLNLQGVVDSSTVTFLGIQEDIDNPDDPTPDDPVDPDAPRPGISGSGAMSTTHALSITGLKNFADWLWNASVFSDFKLLNNSPIDNVVTLKYIPYFDNTWFPGSLENIVLGNVSSPVTARKMAPGVSTKFEIGTVTIEPRYHSFLDYDNTNITIYLPFIGYKELDPYMVMNRELKVEYAIDVVIGSCMAIIKVKNSAGNWLQIHTFDGTIGIDIPINATNRAQIEASVVSSIASAGLSLATENPIGAVGAVLSLPSQTKFKTFTNGHASSNVAYYANKTAYLIIQRPVVEIPKGYAHTVGRPCNKTLRVGSLSGYTKLIDPDLSGIHADQDELESLKAILTSGFYA